MYHINIIEFFLHIFLSESFCWSIFQFADLSKACRVPYQRDSVANWKFWAEWHTANSCIGFIHNCLLSSLCTMISIIISLLVSIIYKSSLSWSTLVHNYQVKSDHDYALVFLCYNIITRILIWTHWIRTNLPSLAHHHYKADQSYSPH